MTVHDKFASLVTRLASATSVRRARHDDAVRLERHGGEPAVLNAKLAAELPELERTARRLEA